MAMFELSVAFKYLVPRWRQLSVSIISLISILVISLVVWLIVVFFSVTNGLEKNWIHKLIALTAPVRINPTDDYYNSHYYKIDSISHESGYAFKSISEKLATDKSNPYDPDIDEEPPKEWGLPDLDSNGQLKDLTKLTYQSFQDIQNIKGLVVEDFEMTFGQLKLRLIRNGIEPTLPGLIPQFQQTQAFLSHQAYLGSFGERNPNLHQSILPLTVADFNNMLYLIDVTADNNQEDNPTETHFFSPDIIQHRLSNLLQFADIKQLKTGQQGWILPKSFLKEGDRFTVLVLMRDKRVSQIFIPPTQEAITQLKNKLDREQFNIIEGSLFTQDHQINLQLPNEPAQSILHTPIFLPADVNLSVQLQRENFNKIHQVRELRFKAEILLQGKALQGEVPLGYLTISDVEFSTVFNSHPALNPFWAFHIEGDSNLSILPDDLHIGDGVLLPKSFKDNSHVLVGDRGYLSYHTPTTSLLQEQRTPIFVAGFYDPGIIPTGGKFILANKDVISLIRATHNQEDRTLSNGFNVHFNDLNQADEVKQQLMKAFKEKKIDRYWTIETFREYEFTKDLLKQLQSEKNLFTLIATVIIIVACSNIISMLIILVNDKKQEIGILKSMGANSSSIAFIFGLCGVFMGLVGGLIGTFAAILTLFNLDKLINFISYIQGYDMFNAAFYGDTLPHELSFEALAFVLIATVLVSLLAGLVPAVKACLMRPSAILRSE